MKEIMNVTDEELLEAAAENNLPEVRRLFESWSGRERPGYL
jgi:hypothetical protein